MWSLSAIRDRLFDLRPLDGPSGRGAASLRHLGAGAGAVAVVAVVANLLVFTDSTTFHAELKGRDLRTPAEGFDVIYYEEGLSGTVTAVERGKYRGLFVDGQNVSGTDLVLLADSKMLAHVPLLLAEEPKVALTVGYGTGTTSGSMLLYDVDVHAVEIEEKIIEAAPLFSAVNYDSYANPDLDIVLDDARNYIATTDQEFSVIVTDVTNLKYKRNPYLYTREYFEIMGDALSEDGVAAAWLPVGGLSFNDLRTLIATFDSVFPHTTAWYFTQFPTHFIILVGMPEPTRVNLRELREEMAKVEHDLRSLDVESVHYAHPGVRDLLPALVKSNDYESLIGMVEDPNFGPLIVFGLGGVFVELIGDVAFRINPLTDLDADDMIQSVKSARLLEGYRGAEPGDVEAVKDALLRVSAMIEDLPELTEMDMNPIKVGPPGAGVRVVDARIRVTPA